MRGIRNWSRLEYAEGVSGLDIYRKLFALYLLLAVVPGRYAWVAQFPDAFFVPPLGPALIFSGFPPSLFFSLVHIGIAICAVLLLAGRHVVAASYLAAALLFGGNLFAYSFGKINHDILLVLAPIVLARAWDDNPRAGHQPTNAQPLAMLALLIALGMFSAALPKIQSGWLVWDQPALLVHLARNFFVTERPSLLAEILLGVESLWVWKTLDYSTVLLEAGFLFAFLRFGLMRVFLAMACLFHVGVLIIMDIAFSSNVMVYAAFVSWHRRALRRPMTWLSTFGGHVRQLPLWVLMVAALLMAGAGEVVDTSGLRSFVNRTVVVLGAMVAIGYLVARLPRRDSQEEAPTAEPR